MEDVVELEDGLEGLNALKSAQTDCERLKALWALAGSFKASTKLWNSATLRHLHDAIDKDFLTRILRDAANDDQRELALALLASFSSVSDLVENDCLLQQLPFVVDILATSSSSLQSKDYATCYISALSVTSKGRDVLVDSDACLMMHLCDVFSATDQDEGRGLLDAITNVVVGSGGSRCWHRCPNAFHVLMNTLAIRFAAIEKSQAKFDFCNDINVVVWSAPSTTSSCLKFKDICRSHAWYSQFHGELMGILCFKLGEAQREPLLKLCAAFVEKFGVDWALGNTERSYRLFLLLVQLSCVEMRMVLEDQTFEHVMSKSELLSACFTVVENAIHFLISDGRHVVTLNARQQLYQALTSAFEAVLQFLSTSAARLEQIVQQGPGGSSGTKVAQWYFVLATIRVVGAWMAEETTSLRAEVHEIFPLLLTICQLDAKLQTMSTESFVYFLLPGFCHLSVEDGPRAVMLAQGLPTLITDYVAALWPKVRSSLDNVNLDVEDSSNGNGTNQEETAIALCCGTLMNIVVLEGRRVALARDQAFLPFLKFVFTALPISDKRCPRHQLVLRGNLAVLGLLLLRRYAFKFAANESAIYRFLSASIRFLWDAFGIDDEFSGGSRLELARNYRHVWDELKELWFLGMQALSSLLPTIPWIGLFIVESGWTETVVSALSKVQPQGVEYGVCREYEGFLVCLTKCCDRARLVLLELGATRMCHTHGMTDLDLVLRGSA